MELSDRLGYLNSPHNFPLLQCSEKCKAHPNQLTEILYFNSVSMYLTTHIHFLLVHRSTPDNYFDIFSHIFSSFFLPELFYKLK